MPPIPHIPDLSRKPAPPAGAPPASHAPPSGRLVALAREHADAFRPHVRTYDRENRFPHAHVDAMKASGYTAGTVPSECGGGGASVLELARAQMALAAGDGPMAVAINMHLFNVAMRADFFRLGDARQRAFLENVVQKHWIVGASTSDYQANTSVSVSGVNDTTRTATPVEGGFRINGKSTFGTLCAVADWFGTSATYTDPQRGERVLNFQVPLDSPGIEVLNNYDTMSIRASASHDVVWKDVFVPAEACVDRPVRTWDRFNNVFFSWFSPSISACYLGIATAARDYAVARAQERVQKPFDQPMSHYPGNQILAGEMEVNLRVARTMLEATAAKLDTAERRADPPVEDLVACQRFCTETAITIVDQAMRMAGGSAIQRKEPLEQHYRDVRAAIIHPPWSGYEGAAMLGKLIFGMPLDQMPRWV
jgi:alkylation response protein AidB-like acyl-CoA dehydrogenase